MCEDDENITSTMESVEVPSILPLTQKYRISNKKNGFINGSLVNVFNSIQEASLNNTAFTPNIDIPIGHISLSAATSLTQYSGLYLFVNNVDIDPASGFICNHLNQKLLECTLQCPRAVISDLLYLHSIGYVKLFMITCDTSNNNNTGLNLSIQIYITNDAFEQVVSSSQSEDKQTDQQQQHEESMIFQYKYNKCIKTLFNYFLNINDVDGGNGDDAAIIEEDDDNNTSQSLNQIGTSSSSDDTSFTFPYPSLFSSNDNNNNNNNNSNSGTTSTPFVFDPKIIYNKVGLRPGAQTMPTDMFQGKVISELKQYQLRTVKWMYDREIKPTMTINRVGSKLHPLWKSISINNKEFCYNEYVGRLSHEPIVSNTSLEVPGGILADEPGIGKTVQLLTLLVANAKKDPAPRVLNAGTKPKLEVMDVEFIPTPPPIKEYVNDAGEVVACKCGKDEDSHDKGIWVQCTTCARWQSVACVGRQYRVTNDHYFCTFCTDANRKRYNAMVAEKEQLREEEERERIQSELRPMWYRDTLIESKTTLIVTPTPIYSQWLDEIKKHTNGLTVLEYHGIYKDNVTPHELASYDIVLTTYDVLSGELHCINPTRTQNRLRYVRVETPKTPLACLVWWRICLDEVQMVESTNSKYLQMAVSLQCRHRWGLSGTPIQRGLSDLFALVQFLRLTPFSDRFWWSHCIESKFNRGDRGTIDYLIELLQQLMVRTTKSMVANELKIPPQYDRDTKLLTFSVVERLYYRRKAHECSEAARTLFNKVFSRNPNATHTSPQVIQKILQPLLVLRQTCQHPQVGSRGVQSISRNTMTMDQLLERLIENASLECKNAQKELVHTINCLAAGHLIKGDHNLAATLYRESLSMIESNTQYFKPEWYQQLHVLHNLDYLVKQGKLTARALRDDDFAAEAEAIKLAYQERKKSHMVKDDLVFKNENEATVELLKEFDSSTRGREWWTAAIQLIVDKGQRADLSHQD
ncbi:hypothetical protein SAMD00019534_089200 [Acytostelium subglobosum LB1]|uniref:hypothetical protein n=1 Tax=Acytostelium subglobosum LB1 TaxID=1410327 RepID=UPI0006451DF8|nr:hypothetical protein SAMD00019534_089200 [Acytostelium subglobosum LB1]GAM25745.1 hypothetical protein SAMD00019534_089200 [Acytostelium subglobosum LB1]|eukprot:XP_012751263.1 hypothetical protein SAMD00019534_089200 [Acytostelium subglobosum LB1]